MPSARRVSMGRVIQDARIESRPNSAMNHGAPAATVDPVGVLGIVDAQGAEVLDAAREGPGEPGVGRVHDR